MLTEFEIRGYKMRIALAGNPNSGKTTMYNALTGSQEKVGNWAGVTVDKKEHAIKRSYCPEGCGSVFAVDLPGAYSMSPFTSEESVTRDYIQTENPDVIINIVDATNLSRSLFFTTQLLELGIPVVVALNKADINKKKKTSIDASLLSEKLGCRVLDTTSTVGDGLADVISAACELVGGTQTAPYTQGEVDMTDREAVVAADRARFEFVNGLVRAVEKRRVFTKNKNAQDKVDEVLTNRWLGIPIFAVVMFFVFQISQAWLGEWLANGIDLESGFHIWGLVDLIGAFKELVGEWMAGATPLLAAIVLEGLIEGVSAVVGFLPLVMVMYFLLDLLDDCGYMARATVVLDPIFKKVGLSGKSVIPFIVGTGCAVPGVMASRTIRDERERRATAMLAPFMPCGAKLPLIALFVGAFFPESGFVGTLMYFAGIVIILLCALLVNKITGNRKKSFFIIELPEYKIPSVKRAAFSMLSRGWSYIVKAGTVILVSNFVIYMMQTFNFSFEVVEDPSESILAIISTPIAYAIAPVVGVVMWQLAAAAVTGFVAKECVVGTLATCLAFEHLIGEDLEIVGGAGSIADKMGIGAVAALAYLMFNLFTPPCFAAIGAMNAELKSKKWLFGGIGLQLSVGFTVAFLTYFFGTLITGGDFGAYWMPMVGWIVIAVIAAVMTILIVKKNKELKV